LSFPISFLILWLYRLEEPLVTWRIDRSTLFIKPASSLLACGSVNSSHTYLNHVIIATLSQCSCWRFEYQDRSVVNESVQQLSSSLIIKKWLHKNKLSSRHLNSSNRQHRYIQPTCSFSSTDYMAVHSISNTLPLNSKSFIPTNPMPSLYVENKYLTNN